MRPHGLVVLGCGTMGRAIVRGLLRGDWLQADHLRVTHHRSAEVAALAADLGVDATSDTRLACAEAELVIVCLKPQQVSEVLDDPALEEALAGKLVVSIAAGVGLERLAALVPRSTRIRAMPNTPCIVGQGMTVLARDQGVRDDQVAIVKRIFESVGRCVELEPKHMDAATALGGSGPAFVYVMLEALADGGVMMGLPRTIAIEMAAQVFLGASSLMLDSHAHPAALKDQVTTPAGCTIAGLLTMEDGRIRSVLARTIQEATQVAGRLGSS
jgi:pyrroline-5-carboxylate reductase